MNKGLNVQGIEERLNVPVYFDYSDEVGEEICVALETDVREKKPLHSINESEQHFRLLGDSILHQVWTADASGNLDYVNARTLEYSGLTMEAALQVVWQDAVHPDDLSLCTERWENSLKTGESYEVEFRMRGADGAFRWHLGRATARFDADGNIIKWFGTNTDINDQKLAEESLRQSEERFQLAARATNDVMWDWDIITNHVWWNKEIRPIFGSSPDECKDKINWWLNGIHADDRVPIASSIHKFLQSREQIWTGEYRFIRPDQSIAEVVDRRIVVRDAQGVPVRMLGSLLDVTDRRQAEKALIESEARLRQSQKMEAIGTLTGGVAHDFNNLLTAILGNTQMALQKLAPEDPLKIRLLEIERAGMRAAELTRQLLAFSRRQHLERRTVNLNETVCEITKLLARIIGEDVELITNCAEDLRTVFADSAQIEQVIMNLCVNARDAMPGGGRLVIETNNVELDESYTRQYAYIQPGRYVEIRISDTGAGMSEEVKARIFEPFFTTKEIGKGTGLGLSMAYGIVKQHDGHINVYSEIGYGTTFKIFLPVSEQSIEDKKPTQQLPMFGGTETILVAEDEAGLRDLAKDVLENLGYKILLARNGEEAIEVYSKNRNRIDLLLFDVVMPRVGGWEAYQRVKNLGCDAPLIFMTGYSSETVQSRFLKPSKFAEIPEIEIIQKPYNVSSLGHKVRAALDMQKKR